MKAHRLSVPPPLPADVRAPSARGSPKPKNLRRATRERIQVKVTLIPVLDDNRKPWNSTVRHATSLDLSEYGIRLSRCGFLPLGSVVRAVFRIPDGTRDVVSCYARVVRLDVCKRPGYGLKFIDFGPGTTRRIRRITRRIRVLAPR